MINNFIRVALRVLRINKTFSLLNIFGLAIGLSCCIIIAGYLRNELSYDKYPVLAKQIYRVICRVSTNGTTEDYSTDAGVGEGIKNIFPEVLTSTRLKKASDIFITYKNRQFKEQHIAIVDSNFLDVFSIPFISGDSKNALKEPNSIVITKSFAQKYFGSEDPLGKTLPIIRGCKVTGVIDKIPDNSHFHFDAFISMTTIPGIIRLHTWSDNGFFTYIVLNKNVDAKLLQNKFPLLVSKYVIPEVKDDMGITIAEAQK